MRVSQKIGEGFYVNQDKVFDSLEELVVALSDPLNLRIPAGGSRFKPFFEGQQELAGYELVEG